MTLAFDHPGVPDSPLGRLDPRWKLVALLLAAGLVCALRTWPTALLALAAAGALAALARLPWRWYLARVAAVVLFLALFVILLPFTAHPDETPWQLGPVAVSPAGTLQALVIVLKSLAVVSLLLVLWATATPEATFKAARAVGFPELLVQLLALSYRYLFLLVEEFHRLRIALRLRGYRARSDLHSFRTLGHVTGTLLVRSAERAERVGHAMRCRGFDGRFRTLTDFHSRPRDALACAAVVAGAAALLAWDLLAH
jgi:cobalt/nickel transport system permease protein